MNWIPFLISKIIIRPRPTHPHLAIPASRFLFFSDIWQNQPFAVSACTWDRQGDERESCILMAYTMGHPVSPYGDVGEFPIYLIHFLNLH